MKRAASKRLASAAPPKKRAGVNVIDEYLAQVPEPARTTLEKLRRTIRAAAPMATEAINYQLPTFRHLGMLVGFRATPKYCALYLMSATVLDPFEGELSAYDTSKGTIRFPADAPLPVALVKKLVKARIAENESKALFKPGASKPSTRRSSPRAKRNAPPA